MLPRRNSIIIPPIEASDGFTRGKSIMSPRIITGMIDIPDGALILRPDTPPGENNPRDILNAKYREKGDFINQKIGRLSQTK